MAVFVRPALFGIILLLFFPGSFTAQQLLFERYSTADGLISDEVYNLFQDNKGYVWLFTNSGISKYDGYRFREVLKGLDADEKFVYSHYQHPDGRMWIATSKARLYQVQGDSAVLIPGLEEFSSAMARAIDEIIHINVDNRGYIYLNTKHYDYELRPSGDGSYSAHAIVSGHIDTAMYRVIEQPGGNLLAIHNYNGNDTTACSGWKNVPISFQLADDTFWQSIPCRLVVPRHFKRFGNDIYISHYDRILKVNREGFTEILAGGIINNFTRDHRGHIWAGLYQKGLVEIDTSDQVVNNYFSHRTVNDVLVDHQNGLWVSTTGLGLFYAPNLDVADFPRAHDLAKPITGIAGLESAVVAGTSDGELYLLRDTGAATLWHSFEGFLIDAVQRHDTCFLSFLPGFMTAVPEKGTWMETGLPKAREIARRLATHRGKIYHVQSRRIGTISHGHFSHWRSFGERIYDLDFLDEYAFVATDNGVYRINLLSEALDTLLYGPRVKELAFTPGGRLLACAPGRGILVFEGTRLVQQQRSPYNLPNNYINSVLYLDSFIVLATQAGVFVRNYTRERDFAGNGDWNRVLGGNVDELVLRGERLYASSSRGLTIIRKKSFLQRPKMLFELAGVCVSGSSVNNRSLEFKSHENSLDFYFDLITFSQERPAVKYSLTGPYNHNGTVNESPIRLSHLPFGTYTISVFPETPRSEQYAVTKTFTIRPAFWQTTTFIVFALIMGAALIFWGTVAVTRYLRRKREKRAMAENKLIEYKLVALKAQINPHFMSNCLAAIQHLITTGKFEKASDYIARFAHLVRQILNFSDKPLVTLKDELALASTYLELEQLRFEHDLKLVVDAEPGIDPGTIYVPSLVLNPIIENAIWHGLWPLRNQKDLKITIGVILKGPVLELVVSDNGMGFTKKPEEISAQSKGLRLIRERLANLNLLYGTNLCRFTIDESAREENPRGSRLSLELPSNLSPLS